MIWHEEMYLQPSDHHHRARLVVSKHYPPSLEHKHLMVVSIAPMHPLLNTQMNSLVGPRCRRLNCNPQSMRRKVLLWRLSNHPMQIERKWNHRMMKWVRRGGPHHVERGRVVGNIRGLHRRDRRSHQVRKRILNQAYGERSRNWRIKLLSWV